MQQISREVNPIRNEALCFPLTAQREAEILPYGHVRVERVVLEDHRHVTVPGFQVVREPSTDVDLSTAEVFEAGNQLQQRTLSATGRPQQDDELSLGDGEIDVLHRWYRTVVLAYVDQLNRGIRGSAHSSSTCWLTASGRPPGSETGIAAAARRTRWRSAL